MEKYQVEDLPNLPLHMRGATCYMVLTAINKPDLTVKKADFPFGCNRLMDKLIKLGLFDKIAPGRYQLNLAMARRVSYIVPDELYEKIVDPEWMFELKKKQGMYKQGWTYEYYLEKTRKMDEKKRARKREARERLKNEDTTPLLEIGEILFSKEE